METSAKARKLKKISRKLGVCALFTIENQTQNKHVESLRIACLDEGSNPSNSTISIENQSFTILTPAFKRVFFYFFFYRTNVMWIHLKKIFQNLEFRI